MVRLIGIPDPPVVPQVDPPEVPSVDPPEDRKLDNKEASEPEAIMYGGNFSLLAETLVETLPEALLVTLILLEHPGQANACSADLLELGRPPT